MGRQMHPQARTVSFTRPSRRGGREGWFETESSAFSHLESGGHGSGHTFGGRNAPGNSHLRTVRWVQNEIRPIQAHPDVLQLQRYALKNRRERFGLSTDRTIIMNLDPS